MKVEFTEDSVFAKEGDFTRKMTLPRMAHHR